MRAKDSLLLYESINKITLIENKKIDKVILSLDDGLQNFFVQEEPSTKMLMALCHVIEKVT